jgi:hypothetical protein
MEKKDYTAALEVAQSPITVFNAINEVTKWWSIDFEGNSTKRNEEFIVNHPGQHYSKQKLVEFIPGKKIVWLVTDSQLCWLKGDPREWTNTKMIFDISSKDDKTVLHFTHQGLVPGKECYAMCARGWDIVVKEWLFHFIKVGAPATAMTKAAEIRNTLLNHNNIVESNNYHRTIIVNASPAEAMKKISQVNHWWKADFTGQAGKLNDQFTVPFGDLEGEKSFVDFIVKEMVPDRKMVWKVTNCNLPWFKDKTEWNNTEVVFDLTADNNQTKIDFTHIGLVPGIECYEACEKGWDGHVTKSLFSLINEGAGNPK